MTPVILAWVALGCAALPALLYFWNSFLFREPPYATDNPVSPPRVSVLIPARNEERGIEACVKSVLMSRGVELEVIVLDDRSEDRTAELVRTLATIDSRVRLEIAPPLPNGWCGKQHACFTLSQHARFPILTFLDADVRLAPDALARMAAFLTQSKAGLVSGFPRQETGTLLEKLVVPLIHFVLLGFLPIAGMRLSRWSAFGAGCGQWFMTTREAYDAVGGHAAVKRSLHDGVTLPRAYRRAGFMTDICDATNVAVCRMYRSAEEVWFGFAKNAREGMAATGQILFWTMVLFCGQVLPVLLLGVTDALWPVLAAVCLVYFTRAHMAVRFHQSPLGWLLHPLGILVLLAIQWYAVYRAVIGRPVGWKGRSHPITRPDPRRSPDPPSP